MFSALFSLLKTFNKLTQQSHNGDFLVVGLTLILSRNKADLIMVIVAQATDVAHGHIVIYFFSVYSTPHPTPTHCGPPYSR